MDIDHVLSADYLYSTADILDEYRRRCEEAAETHTYVLDEPRFFELAGDVCRVLDIRVETFT